MPGNLMEGISTKAFSHCIPGILPLAARPWRLLLSLSDTILPLQFIVFHPFFQQMRYHMRDLHKDTHS